LEVLELSNYFIIIPLLNAFQPQELLLENFSLSLSLIIYVKLLKFMRIDRRIAEGAIHLVVKGIL